MDKIGSIHINKDTHKNIEIVINGKAIDVNGLQNIDIHIEYGIISVELNYKKIYGME